MTIEIANNKNYEKESLAYLERIENKIISTLRVIQPLSIEHFDYK